MKRYLGALLSLAVCACSSTGPFDGTVCTLELRSTIRVDVTDARTSAAIALGSTVIVKGSAVYDSVVVTSTPMGPGVAYLAWEDRVKKGRYSVEVRKPGYVTFVKTDVDVPGDQCHSGPGPSVQAVLQPTT